jgi:hypothetical protein
VLLFGVPAVVSLVLVAAGPLATRDVYHYLAEGRIWGVFGLNPYLFAPAQMPRDAVFTAAYSWGGVPSRYGPLHLFLMAAIAKLTGGSVVAGVLAVKLASVLFLLAALVAVRSAAERLEPGTGDLAVVYLGWNPLVLFDGVANVHNDLLLAALAAVALALALRREWRWAWLALAASILLKWVTVAMAPLFAVYFWRTELEPAARRRGLAGVGIAVLITLVLYAPLYAGWRTLPLAFADVPAANSIFALLDRLPVSVGGAQIGLLASRSRALLFALVLLGLTVALARSPTPARLVRGSLAACAACLFLLSKACWPWYAILLVALASPLAAGRAGQASFVLSASFLSMHAVFMWRHLFGVAAYNSEPYTFVVVGVLFGPTALWLLGELARAGARRGPAGDPTPSG